MITRFDKPTISTVRKDIEQALAAVEEKHGIEIRTGNARFTGLNVKMKIELCVIDDDGRPLTPEREALDHAIAHGLIDKKWAEGWHAHPSPVRDNMIRVTGYKSRNRKYPVLFVDKSGGQYKAPRDLFAAAESS